MIQITPQMRILLAVEPADFRKGIDGLAQLCRQRLQADPLSGAMFVFSNRRRKALKILVYDGQGFWLCQNMHDPKCAVIEIRKSPLPLPPAIRPGVGSSWRRWGKTRCGLCDASWPYDSGCARLDVRRSHLLDRPAGRATDD